MKAVILAGGYGTRISEETAIRPKPMVEIGGKPILWHIMKIYSAYGINDFIICCGYKGEVIKQYFADYFLNNSDVTFDFLNNTTELHPSHIEPWRVTLVDTGMEAMTGGRLKKVKKYIGQETFCMTYGDGVSDVNLKELITFHKAQDTLATLTAVQQPNRFGIFNLTDNDARITEFMEKPNLHESPWVNGGFFVLEPEVLDYIHDDSTLWEREPLENLAKAGELTAYRHSGFWQSMDTVRDRNLLEDLWQRGEAPWKHDLISKNVERQNAF